MRPIRNEKAKNAALIAAGLAAGAVNGFLGGGGGTVLVTALISLAGLEPRRALATSVAAVAPVCAVSAAVYLLSGRADLGGAWPYLLGGAAGGAAGGLLLGRVRGSWAARLFGAMAAAAGVRLLWAP